MTLIDANLLIYAVDETSPRHEQARRWITDQLNGDRRVALPWPSLLAFVRIATHPRAMTNPLDGATAWTYVEQWLDNDVAFVPHPTVHHVSILGGLIARHQLSANLIPDAHLAALAIEHGLTVCSADTDFARFDEIAWSNPVS